MLSWEQPPLDIDATWRRQAAVMILGVIVFLLTWQSCHALGRQHACTLPTCFQFQLVRIVCLIRESVCMCVSVCCESQHSLSSGVHVAGPSIVRLAFSR